MSTAIVGTGTLDWPAARPPGTYMLAMAFREFGPPEVLRQEDLATPRPAPGEVLVQVAAVSIGRLLDVAARAGRHPYPGFRFPHILGAEHSGIVASLGEGVSGWKVGDRVATFPVITDGSCEFCLNGQDELCVSLQLIGMHRPGAYAEYVAVPARNLSLVPEGISPTQATGLALSGAVAMNQLTRAQIRPGQWVLVQGGSSALGSITASLARHLGARVVTTSRSAAKRDRLTELGADAVLDSNAPDFAAALARITDGHGADIVVDNLGDALVWSNSLAALRPGGRLVSSGAFLRGDLTLDLSQLYLKGQQIIGVRSGNAASVKSLWREVANGFRPVIDTTFELTRAAAAHAFVEADSHVGRVALVLS